MRLSITSAITFSEEKFWGVVCIFIILIVMIFSWVYINMYLHYTSKKAVLKDLRNIKMFTCFASIKQLD